MKINLLCWPLHLLRLNLALAVLAAGCATHEMHSYNQDFNQSLPGAPNYYIENLDDNHFKLTVSQGTFLPGPDRIIYVKPAASIVAGSEAKRRGWSDWDLNYVQDRDSGWMRVVIGEVTRKNAAEKTSDPAK